jgi:D-lactate dehydrogenase
MKNPMNAHLYDGKPYDREYFLKASAGTALQWEFHEFRLNAATAATARDARSVCIFVNDLLDRRCLETLAHNGIEFVALRCAGYNNVDLAAAADLGLRVVRVPAYSPHAVAEHAVALLLTLNRKIHRAHNRVREQNFSLNGLVGFDLFGKTVGIVGTGRIGRIAAGIFQGFGTNVIACDAFPELAWAAQRGIVYRSLPELLAESDVVSLHVPLLPDTHHLLNERTLGLLKPGAYVINTSRGKLIDTGALIARLKAGLLGGVALDVYEEEEGVFFEDLSDQVLQDDELSRLLSFPNVLVTSHQAFLTREALTEIARVTVENLRRWQRGQLLLEGTELLLDKS